MTAFQTEYVVFLLPPFLFCQYSFHFTDEDTETQSVHETCQSLIAGKGTVRFFSRMYILCIPGYFWTVISPFRCVEKNMFSICFF